MVADPEHPHTLTKYAQKVVNNHKQNTKVMLIDHKNEASGYQPVS